MTIHITGGADDIEYFDNGKVGTSGLDWFRIEYQGKEPRLFTANLALPDPLVVAAVRCSTRPTARSIAKAPTPTSACISRPKDIAPRSRRTLQPGGVYFLKVEANSPGYEVELRMRRPAPYTDPRARRSAGHVRSPGPGGRVAAEPPARRRVDRRIRDTGSLLGTHCMSCHTQSGVWGPAGPMQNGYRIENVVNFRHLVEPDV